MNKTFKTFIIILSLTMSFTLNANDDINGKKNADAVIFNGGQPHRLKDIPVLEGNWWQIHDKLAHNLMGDPEISMWTNEPVSYYGITRQNNDNSISISFSEGDTIIVGISDGIRQYMKSSSIGNVTFTNINPNSTVMVYRHNYLPYIAPLYLQNEPIKRSQYVIANDVFAGRNVDNNRTAGDLTIASGSEYEIETKGQVVLAPGFTVEKGALFSVMLSDY